MNTKDIQTLLMAVILVVCASAPSYAQQNNDANYIRNSVYTRADSSMSRKTVAYYDGLGRPVQTVRKGASLNGGDIADMTEYDSLGRKHREWMNVGFSSGAAWPSSPLNFKDTARVFKSDVNPYTETLYDGSPLDRVRKVTGPGANWHTNQKGVTKSYLTNAGSSGDAALRCARYTFSLSGNTGITIRKVNPTIWPAGSLAVERTEDEDGRTLWLFKDMRDLTILERRLAEEASGNNPALYADTYYLYDDAGRLVAVLPPELSWDLASGSWSDRTGSDPAVEGFAYQYRYDARGRMIAKKLPGAAWTYYVYDRGDRLVLTQDGNQRPRNEWSFRLQDKLGRECLTGTLSGSYNAFADPLGATQVLAERVSTSGNYDNLHGYSVSGLTLPSGADVLTVNWWDDYEFLEHEPGMIDAGYGYSAPAANSGYDPQYAASWQGLLTGHWSKALGTAPNAWSTAVREAWYYDDHGREVRHVKGYPSGARMTEQSGYAFSGERTALGRTMLLPDNATRTEAYTYTYDEWGRLENTTHRLNGGTAILLSANTYDAAGRLSQTKRGGTSVQTSTSSLTDSYTYNVRDWMTGISGTLFSETLTYETPRTGSTLPGQWGGNISSSSWTAYHTANQWYDYDYDPLGRLSEAAYGCSNSLWADRSRSYTYDLNGNLEAMETPDRSIAPAFNDDLCAWSWNSGNGSGNRPTGWEQELFTEEEIFIPATPGHPAHTATVLNPITGGTVEEYYSYDAVGNRTAETTSQNDTLRVTSYNRLNLPEEYTTASGDEVQYVYSADGEKLFVQLTTSANVTTGTEYAANYRVENGTLTMIHTDAGYYTPVPPPSGVGNPTYKHIWYLKDHLGNNRVLADASGTVYAVNDYDPFGNSMTSPITGTQPSFPAGMTASPYKYGGKEWNTTTSTYDFEARQMAPGFHRFTTMDPLCEKYYGISPYAYCANNPVNMVDPSGKIILIYDSISNCNIHYCNGTLSYADGKEYKGNNHFVFAIRDALNTIKSLNDDYVSGVLATLEDSEQIHTFVYDTRRDESVEPKGDFGHSLGDDGTPVGTWIFLTLSRAKVDGVDNTIESTVAHEISHSYDYDQGKMKDLDPWMGTGINPAEIKAVNFENRIRARMGLPLRRKYHGTIPPNKLENPYSKKSLR